MFKAVIRLKSGEKYIIDSFDNLSITTSNFKSVISKDDILSDNFNIENGSLCFYSDRSSFRINGSDILYLEIYMKNIY